MTYQPAPIDTRSVSLPTELVPLREQLSKNAHDLWATQRMSDGWVWGPERNDPQKQHPCLVPYEELPESEKEYDRLLAMETLRTIIALGFRITKSS